MTDEQPAPQCRGRVGPAGRGEPRRSPAARGDRARSELGLEAAPTIIDRTISTFVRGEKPHFAGETRHVLEVSVHGGRQRGRRRRGRDLRRAAGYGRDLPTRHAVRAAGNPALDQPVWHLQLRTRRRSARAAQHRRHRRRVHHPGQSGEVVRPDQPGDVARRAEGRHAGRARGRPLDRLSRPSAASRRTWTATSASSTSTATSTPRRPTSTSGCTPRRGSTPPTSRTPRRPTWSRSASAAGRAPREGVKVGRERGSTVITVGDVERVGVEKIAEMALEIAWKGAKAVYLSFDIDVIDAGFVPAPAGPSRAGCCRARRSTSSRWCPSPAWPASRSSSARRPTTGPSRRR